MDTRVSFASGKAAGAWSWTLTSIWCRGHECVELYLHSPLRFIALCLVMHRDNFTFTRWRWVVSFTPRLFYPHGKSSRYHWLGGWVGSRVGLDTVSKRKIPSPAGIRIPIIQTVLSRYPGSVRYVVNPRQRSSIKSPLNMSGGPYHVLHNRSVCSEACEGRGATPSDGTNCSESSHQLPCWIIHVSLL
jgi:hypothetical protein